MRIAVTGVKGLLGWHTAGRLHAANCAARFKGATPPYDIAPIGRDELQDVGRLGSILAGCSAVLHFAGVNRGPEDEVEAGNPAIATALVAGCEAAGVRPHIVYANSTHASSDSPYGRSKRIAGEILARFADRYTDLVLPHIFGEFARPHYNNVTATLIDQIWNGERPSVNPGGRVNLLHAGEAAAIAIDAAEEGRTDQVTLEGRAMTVSDLLAKLEHFHALYAANIFPDLNDAFNLALFNAFRSGGYPERYPMPLRLNTDARGTLFETVKGGNGGQSFMSSTVSGARRGDHFHLTKVERFIVVQGEALIRIRRVLTDDVREFHVTGKQPMAIDMPPLHTHNIENVGDQELLTLFWTHDMFDPARPDTYADPV